jgi:hypothetical protein
LSGAKSTFAGAAGVVDFAPLNPPYALRRLSMARWLA